jgi:hypothetical protein
VGTGFLRKQLRRQPLKHLLVGISLMVFTSALSVTLALVFGAGQRAWPLLVGFAVLWAIGLSAALKGGRGLVRMDDHPDLLALRRFGIPGQVEAEIEAELADKGQVVRIGKPARGGDLGGEQVILTRSWLIYLTQEDDRLLRVFRLDSLVWAYRSWTVEVAAVVAGERAASAYLADRHGVRLQIPGTPGAITRLLAEVLARVPWVLNRFDEDAERAWREDRGRFIADVDRRRGQIR